MRLPRVRFTVRRMMVAVAVLAVGIAAWAMYDPHKHHPYRIALNETLHWAKSGPDRFDPQYSRLKKKCLLKITRNDFFWDDIHDEHWHVKRTVSVSEAGECLRSVYTPETSLLESEGTIPTEAFS